MSQTNSSKPIAQMGLEENGGLPEWKVIKAEVKVIPADRVFDADHSTEYNYCVDHQDIIDKLGCSHYDELWLAAFDYCDGTAFNPKRAFIKLSELEAQQAVERHPVGSSLIATPYRTEYSQLRTLEALGKNPSTLNVNPDQTANNILIAEGMMSDAGLPSDVVRQFFLSGSDVKNWDFLNIISNSAEMIYHYCAVTQPVKSAAMIAASYNFEKFVQQDMFKAGYLARDLEIYLSEIETIAKNTTARSKKAGLSGSKKSAEARNSRRAKLWDAIEELCQRNPDIAQMGEDIIVNPALAVAEEKDPALWRQGKGQAKEYLAEIRRGEAGKELQAKYEELFGRKPPKRS